MRRRTFVALGLLALPLVACGSTPPPTPTPDPREQTLRQQLALYDTWYRDPGTQVALASGMTSANYAAYEARRAQFTREYPLFGSYLVWWQIAERTNDDNGANRDALARIAAPADLANPVKIAAYLASH